MRKLEKNLTLSGLNSYYIFLDASGNPVTQQVQSVGVTDANGNSVTGIKY